MSKFLLKQKIKKNTIPVLLYIFIGFILNLSSNNGFGYYHFIYLILPVIYIIIVHQIDLSFLHNKRHLVYVKSKPNNLYKYVMTITVINFVSFLLMVIPTFLLFQFNVSLVNPERIFEFLLYFFILIPIIGLIVMDVASTITGNTIVAIMMSIFLFLLPLILVTEINLVISFIERDIPGFTSNVLFSSFVNFNIYGIIMYLYLIQGSFYITFGQIMLWLIYACGLSLLLKYLLANRKNEIIGKFIIPRKMEIFTTVTLSLLFAISVAELIFRNHSLFSRLIVFLVIIVISEYVLSVIVRKSFIVPKDIFMGSFKAISVISMVLVILVAGIYNRVTYIPSLDEIESATIGRMYNNDVQIFETVPFTSKETVNHIRNYQKYLIDNNAKRFGDIVSIKYVLKNGKIIRREYRVEHKYVWGQELELIENIMNTRDYRDYIFPYRDDFQGIIQVTQYKNGQKFSSYSVNESNEIVPQIIEKLHHDIDNKRLTIRGYDRFIVNDLYEAQGGDYYEVTFTPLSFVLNLHSRTFIIDRSEVNTYAFLNK